MSWNCTQEDFLKDVATHEMKILRDDGVHRHIQFRKPGTYCMGFDLITWPGYLCYTGDMGTYVFTRLEDMFQFFRRRDESYAIDKRYWAEKCVAADRDGIKEYSADKFRAVVADRLEQAEASEELRKAVAEEVLPFCEFEHEARDAANSFESDAHLFQDFWESDLTVFTGRFTWCCYALGWAIKVYDQSKENVPA